MYHAMTVIVLADMKQVTLIVFGLSGGVRIEIWWPNIILKELESRCSFRQLYTDGNIGISAS